MTPVQLKHMVDRFLGWRLPTDFNPDAGISFKAEYNEHTPWPSKHQPIGTNLFNADQATAMVQYMVEGMPADPQAMPDVCQRWKAERDEARAALMEAEVARLRAAIEAHRPRQYPLYLASRADLALWAALDNPAPDPQ